MRKAARKEDRIKRRPEITRSIIEDGYLDNEGKRLSGETARNGRRTECKSFSLR